MKRRAVFLDLNGTLVMPTNYTPTRSLAQWVEAEERFGFQNLSAVSFLPDGCLYAVPPLSI